MAGRVGRIGVVGCAVAIVVGLDAAPVDAQVTVHVAAYLGNQKATPASASNQWFSMQATWSQGYGPQTTTSYSLRPGGWMPALGDQDYEASLFSLPLGTDFSTAAVIVGGGALLTSSYTCIPGKYQLVGYTIGASLAEAKSRTPYTSAPYAKNLQADWYVIVWIKACPTLIVRKTAIFGNNTFTMTGNGGIGTFSITTMMGVGEKEFRLGPGTYHISEHVLDGWILYSNSCATIVIPPYPTKPVRCEVVNVMDMGVVKPKTLQIHIKKYLDGRPATAVAAGGYAFPMTASFSAGPWSPAGSLDFVLGPTGHGGAGPYMADLHKLTVPAFFTTREITRDHDPTSRVLPFGAPCVEGKFRLVGYSVSDESFEDAATNPILKVPFIFHGLGGDRYIIVWNEKCQLTGTLIVEKITIFGGGTFNFRGDGPIGYFSITTTHGTGSKRFDRLQPGTYNITEDVPDGWLLYSNGCTNVKVKPGEITKCFIINVKC